MATSSLQSDLTCSVCLELYTEPLLLKCMHSFCRHCLSQIVEKKSKFGDDDDGRVCSPEERNLQKQQDKKVLECPDCRYVVILDEEGVEGLPRNFTLNNIVENFKKNSEPKSSFPCAVCERDPPRDAVKHCQQCRISYCEECLEQIHPKRGILAKHTLVTPSVEILEKESELHPNSQAKFQQAVTDTDMWCKTCAVIYNCDSGKKHHIHNKHDTLTLKNAKIHMMSEMERMTLNLEQKKRKYGHMITSAEESVAHLMERVAYFHTEEELLTKTEVDNVIREDDAEKKSLDIKHSAEKLRSMANVLERECLSALKKDTASKAEKRQDQIDAEKQHVTEIGHILRDVTAVLDDQSNDALFVQKLSENEKRIKNILDKQTQIDGKMEVSDDVDTKLTKAVETVQSIMKGDTPVIKKAEVEGDDTSEKTAAKKAPVRITSIKAMPSQTSGVLHIEWKQVSDCTYDVKLVHTTDTGKIKVISLYNIPEHVVTMTDLQFYTCYDVTVSLHDNPDTESNTQKVWTLPEVICPEFVFDKYVAHEELSISADGKVVAHEETETWGDRRLKKVVGTVGTYEISEGQMYWEIKATFNTPDNRQEHVFETGICSEGKFDIIQDLHKNYNSYVCDLVEDNNPGAMTLFFDTEGFEKHPNCRVSFVNTNAIHLGFFLNLYKKTFSVIDVAHNKVYFTYFNLKTNRTYVPVFGKIFEDYGTTIELLTGSGIEGIPSIIRELM